MEDFELLDKKTISIKMGSDPIVSTNKYSILATKGIATCIGILLYNENSKKGLIYHASSNTKGLSVFDEACNIYRVLEPYIYIYNFIEGKTKYLLLSGDKYYKNMGRADDIIEEVKELFKKLYKNFEEFDNIPYDAIKMHEDTRSLEFAFDTKSGEFVSNILFSDDLNYEVHKEKNNINS